MNWTPDSSSVCVQRLNRVQNELDLLSADPATGAAKLLVHETDPTWINADDDFHFLSTGQFIWSSEHDGYRHLYLFNSDGKQANRITEGNWEVTGIAGIDEKNKRVYYVSSEASPLERQLYSINLDGTGKKRLTQASGTHGDPDEPGARLFHRYLLQLDQPHARDFTHHRWDGLGRLSRSGSQVTRRV